MFVYNSNIDIIVHSSQYIVNYELLYQYFFMIKNTRENILMYIIEHEPATINSISDNFGISKRMVHKHLNILLDEKKIIKVWKAPKVFYFQDKNNYNQPLFNDNYLENNFINFSPNGEVAYWITGFINWCQKRKLDYNSEIDIYKKTISKYNKFKTNQWLINWIDKMKSTFEKTYLNEIFYLDFYSIEKYGKTYLWNLMFYAKQTWDRELANKILETIKYPIYKLINEKNIDSFAFIPPSIDRKTQLMDELREWLNINLKELKLIKIFKDKIVAQKSLNRKEDRIQNAMDTIFILKNDFNSNTILLIDDAVWSWATLNETAKKIKEKKIAKNVIWLAIVWSYKWFEVINEI